MRRPTILTIGHSTRTLEHLVAVLRAHDVEEIVDIRRYPGSRRHPHFSRDALTAGLANAGIAYVHAESLGGRREPREESPNGGLRNRQFRGYADHMATESFTQALGELLERAARRRIAVMCAESVPWRCHRSLLADALTARGIPVEHILNERRRDPHTLTPAARLEGVVVTYPDEQGTLLL